jgi:hypothetical protein
MLPLVKGIKSRKQIEQKGQSEAEIWQEVLFDPSKLLVTELRYFLNKLELNSKGSKVNLIARIIQARELFEKNQQTDDVQEQVQNQKDQVSNEKTLSEEDIWKEIVDPTQLLVKGMRMYLTKLNLNSTGTKSELVDRLMAAKTKFDENIQPVSQSKVHPKPIEKTVVAKIQKQSATPNPIDKFVVIKDTVFQPKPTENIDSPKPIRKSLVIVPEQFNYKKFVENSKNAPNAPTTFGEYDSTVVKGRRENSTQEHSNNIKIASTFKADQRVRKETRSIGAQAVTSKVEIGIQTVPIAETKFQIPTKIVVPLRTGIEY